MTYTDISSPSTQLRTKLKNLKPISLAPKKHNGVPIGAKVNGKLVPLYEIQDGRHRVAKALAEGKTTIDAKIV